MTARRRTSLLVAGWLLGSGVLAPTSEAENTIVANRVFVAAPTEIAAVRLSFDDAVESLGAIFEVRAFEIVSEVPGRPTRCFDDDVVTMPIPGGDAAIKIRPSDRMVAGSVWIGVPEHTEIWKRAAVVPTWELTRPMPLLVGYTVSFDEFGRALTVPADDQVFPVDASFVSFDGGTTWECWTGMVKPPAHDDDCPTCGSSFNRIRTDVEEPEE